MIYFALLVALILRPTVGAFMFVFVAISHLIIADIFTDPAYYLSAALFDLFVINFLASMNRPTSKTLQLQWLSVVSLLTNFIGWGMWYAYLDPMMYNATFSALYLTAFIIILQQDDDINGIGRNSIYSRIYSAIRSGGMVSGQHGATL